MVHNSVDGNIFLLLVYKTYHDSSCKLERVGHILPQLTFIVGLFHPFDT